MKHKKLRKVYANGGDLTGAIAGSSLTLLDSLTPTSRPPSMGLGIAKGAAAGALAGSVVPGWGTAIGAVVGGVAGAFTTHKAQRDDINKKGMEQAALQNQDLSRSTAQLAGSPSLVYGNANADYFNLGGQLKHRNFLSRVPQTGGKLNPLSSQNTEVLGPSHVNGGVQLPGFQAELEGTETTSGDKVFSAELGFAQLHKPIAKAIGKIESKAYTAERINALQRLKEREETLYAQQEQLKASFYGY